MSRDPRDDTRPADTHDRIQERPAHSTTNRSPDFAARDLDLPRTDSREHIDFRGRDFTLNGQESRLLATVGAFRVLSFDESRSSRSLENAVRHLKTQGLLTTCSIADRAGTRHVLTLTIPGKDLLESRRDPSTHNPQRFYAGIAKPRELAHDSRLYEVFLNEAAELERSGNRIARVALDYELKGDYQRYLNRPKPTGAPTPDEDGPRFAGEHGFHLVDGHVAFPDLRIEYETSDGRTEFRDVELVTEHYSRGQLGAKAAAGFVRYGSGSRARSSGRTKSAASSTPFDPRHLERLV